MAFDVDQEDYSQGLVPLGRDSMRERLRPSPSRSRARAGGRRERPHPGARKRGWSGRLRCVERLAWRRPRNGSRSPGVLDSFADDAEAAQLGCEPTADCRGAFVGESLVGGGRGGAGLHDLRAAEVVASHRRHCASACGLDRRARMEVRPGARLNR